MENIPDKIGVHNSSLIYFSVTSTVVKNMWCIVGIIINNQASGGKRLISEAGVDTLRVYVYCSGYGVDEVLKVDLYQME